MKCSLFVACALATIFAVAFAAPSVPQDPLFDAWRAKYNKVYSSVEEHVARIEVFTRNAGIVERHNAANHSWTMALNEFADLTSQEFATRLGLKGRQPTHAGESHVMSGLEANASVDWRDHNLVTPVKNQGSCGSCWAFSTVVSMEGQVAKSSGKLTSLSEQDLVDCVKDVVLPGDSQKCCDGCAGGLMDYAFKYMIDSQKGGDDTETSYPYRGALSHGCKFKSSDVGGTIQKFTDVKDEKTLLDAVTTVGPISVGVDASIGWQLYHAGVMDPWPIIGCSDSPKKMDHGVAVVGYGSSGSKDYWIVKNSWGGSWGEKGYMRLVRNKNACGVANGAVYPTV